MRPRWVMLGLLQILGFANPIFSQDALSIQGNPNATDASMVPINPDSFPTTRLDALVSSAVSTTDVVDGVTTSGAVSNGIMGSESPPTGSTPISILIELTSSVGPNGTNSTLGPPPGNQDARVSIWAIVLISILITIAGVLTVVYLVRFYGKRRRQAARHRLLNAVSQEGFFVGSGSDIRYDNSL